jgi:oligo-alginate lyase
MKLILQKKSLLAALSLFTVLPSTFAQTVALPPHPRLLLNSNGIVELRERIATALWAKTSWGELKTNVDKGLMRPVALPPRGGNWGHNYVCPIHGAHLEQGRKIGQWQWEHICPVGNHVLTGDPSKATLDFDGNAMMAAHLNFAQQVLDDGLVFQVTGDARYARQAREILLAYAGKYLSYPVHDNQGRPGGRGGHVASQSLTEATWLIAIAQGADLVWDTLSDEDRRAIEEKILRPALNEIIIPQKYGIHNIQCRQNSAIGLTGFFLGDQKLISLAIDDPQSGYRQQLAKGVNADGLWLEGSSGYHFFTIEGLWPLAEAARNCGIDLYGAKLKSMFDGPFAIAMPNLMLPNFNDSGVSPLRERASAYELAFARFHDARYVSLFGKRDNRMALIIGAITLPAGQAIGETKSRNLTAAGYAVLQQGAGTNATWLATKYGPHGGGHGHPDKNTFILYTHGQILSPDAGTHSYGSPLHTGWDKTTLAHDTLVVDEKSQAPAQGKCLAFGKTNGVDFSVTDAGRIYTNASVNFTRTVAMLTTNLVVIVDQIQADAPHTYDLAYHQMGVWDGLPAGEAWSPPSVPGYKYFTQTTTRKNAAGATLQTKMTDNWSASVILAGGELTEVITGYGILKTTEDLVPLLLQRRRAQNTAFVWAVSMDGAPVKLSVLDVKDAAGKILPRTEAVRVEVNFGKTQRTLLVNPQRKAVAANSPDDSPAQSAEVLSVR